MNKENILTKNNYEEIFHPLLLKTFKVKENDYAIFPEYNKSEKIDNYKNISNKKKTIGQVLSSDEIDELFFSNSFFLMANLEINKIDDVFDKMDEMFLSNKKKETVDFILNIIFEVFKGQIDDIYIDKFIIIYNKYFETYYSTEIEYKIIFNNIQKELNLKNKKIHNEIVNNILKK
jgi:hypothetical protein